MPLLPNIRIKKRYSQGAHSVAGKKGNGALRAPSASQAGEAVGGDGPARSAGRAEQRVSQEPERAPVPERTPERAPVLERARTRRLYTAGAGVFVALALALLALPALGLFWHTTSDGEMSTELSAFPSMQTQDGAPNVDIAGQLGTWFEEHFAFRPAFVEADATLRSNLFGVSNTDQVIVGSDGWLYYGGTLDDYLARNALSERGADNIAFNLKLMQDALVEQGKSFVFAIAPNKNSLYPQHMPYYYSDSSVQDGTLLKSISVLVPALEKRGVNYVDLFAPLQQEEKVQYLKRDTHWNNSGARVAYNSILAALGKPHEVYRGQGQTSAGEVGDLDALLNLSSAQPEENVEYGQSTAFTYAADSAGNSVTDDIVKTYAQAGEGTLFMFRDSFGNALLPFMASAYKEATFSKMVPYSMSAIEESDADTVVVERAERHVADLGTDPPSMLAPKANEAQEPVRSVQSATDVRCYRDGDYLCVEGLLDKNAVDEDSDVFVSVHSVDTPETEVFIPFRTSRVDADGAYVSDYGYKLYCNAGMVGGSIESGAQAYVTVMARKDGDLVSVMSQSTTIE